jgi:hypothetical protein
MPESARER